MDKPTVGGIVHYKENQVIYPAIVLHVWSDTCVNLGVFGAGYYLKTSVVQGKENGEWQWPVREEEEAFLKGYRGQ